MVEDYIQLMEELDIKTSIGSLTEHNEISSDEFVDLTEEDNQEIEETIEATLTADSSLKSVIDCIHSIQSKFLVRGFKYSKVTDTIVLKVEKFLNDNNVEKLRDDVIKKLEELTPKNDLGEEIELEENKSPLKQLQEAIAEYLNGNEEPLKELATPNDGTEEDDESNEDESNEDESNEDESNEDESNEDESNEDTSNEDTTDGEEDENEIIDSRIRDCANHILNPSYETNSCVEELYNEVPMLQQYNFQVSEQPTPLAQVEPTDLVPEAPITRSDFYSLYKTPGYIKQLTEPTKECIPVKEVSVDEIGNLVTNESGMYQTWLPITGSCEQHVEKMQSMSDSERAKYVKENFILKDSYLKACAVTNNLAEIDNRFYKTKLSDECWTFDECPACIATTCPDLQGSCRIYPSWADVPVDSYTTLMLYGSPYKLIVQ